MSKFNKRIDEMLVVLNAVKKPKKDKEESEVKVDPVTDLMNDTLGRFGVNVSSDKPEDDSDSKEDNEDPIEGSLDELGDLDLPRPADDSGEGEEGEDHSPDFDFMNVGSPTDVKPTDDTNFKDADDLDDGGEGKIRFEYQPGKGVGIGIGGEEAFQNVSVDSVYIPANVTYIGTNAIPRGTLIFGDAGSYAISWAARNNYPYYVMNGAH